MDLDADATNVEQLPVEPPVIPPRRKIKTTTLRDLEQSDRHFWKDSLAEQLAQSVKDKSTDGNLRKLPGNETTVMALNEIAVQRGRGFFYHFRETHGGWKSHSNEDLWPGSRDHRPGYVCQGHTRLSSNKLTSEQNQFPKHCLHEFCLDLQVNLEFPSRISPIPVPDMRWSHNSTCGQRPSLCHAVYRTQ